ncbi:phosphonate ABC transporter ATP-binding protein [Pseudonocardia aurantiaca]|uniref:Phosphonate ABC transporter ATP-binding protein n=1 Tax=Pseudonocardia aurantiaca TaxID=75290 RepID=A0ABW4FXV0_9PSEU
MTAKIVAEGLSLRYPNGHEALRGVDLVVRSGELVALVGSNGAGKSSLLRCLVRLQEPTGGRAVTNGVDVRRAGKRQLRRLRQDVGFVFQRFNLVDRISVFQNVVHGAIGREGTRCVVPAFCTAAVRTEAMECLDRVGLAHLAGRRVDTLSGGQRQRVAIARTLMQKPRLVLADEPVASLDPAAGQDVMELLRSIAVERDLTVVAALHQVDFALTYTQRIVGLQDGRVTLDRPTAGCTAAQLSAVYGGDQQQLEKVN